MTIINNLSKLTTPPLLNINSAIELFESASTAEFCVFFNAKVELEEWFDPAMQFHFFIQKCTEQANNYNSLTHCHRFKEDGKYCVLPCRKNIRIMFFPQPFSEIDQLLRKNEIPALINIIYAHVINGVPLAIIPIDKFVKVIKSINFNSRELECLNIPHFYDKNGLDEKEKYIKRQLFSEENRSIIDFTIINRINREDNSIFSEIWTGGIENNQLYYKLNYTVSKELKTESCDKDYWKTKLDIGRKIFEEVCEQKKFTEIPTIKLSKMDPVFYVHNKLEENAEMVSIKSEYCAIVLLKTYE